MNLENVKSLIEETEEKIQQRNEFSKQVRAIIKYAPATFTMQRLINKLKNSIEDLQEDINANLALLKMLSGEHWA